MTVVWKAEFAQSYISHPVISRRSSRGRASCRAVIPSPFSASLGDGGKRQLCFFFVSSRLRGPGRSNLPNRR
jgi:hypothetical protein